MNTAAKLRVTIQVTAAGTQNIKALQNALDSLKKSGGGVAGALAGGGNAATLMGNKLSALGAAGVAAGKNLQWTGRQLTYSFTLPLALAAGAATKWALDNETASTRLRKVYTLIIGDQQKVNAELKLLGDAFLQLSNIFGVHQAEVLNIAASWAEAGVTGVALARATRLTLETMILGNTDAETSTTALVTIMQQYGLTTKELRLALADLNVANKETAISFSDLVSVVQRGGGFARVAGVDLRHLAAMAAALVPAAGSAESAGNGLKTMLSRILAPTTQAADALALLGVNVTDAGWQSLNGAQRLEVLAEKSTHLTASQKAIVDSIIAGRFQLSRFSTLLADVVNPLGNYQRVLRATGDDTKALASYQRELGIYLSSQPQAFKILWTQLQNGLAQAILPLLPNLLALLQYVVNLVHWFTSLDPSVQQLALSLLVLLAAVGPVVRYMGAFKTLFHEMFNLMGFGFTKFGNFQKKVGELGTAVGKLGTAFVNLGRSALMSGPMQTLWLQMMYGADAVRSAMQTLWLKMMSGAQAAFKGIQAAWAAVWRAMPAIAAAGQRAIAIVAEGLRIFFLVLYNVMTIAWTAMWAAMSAIAAAGATAIELIVTAVAAAWPEILLAAAVIGIVGLIAIFHKQIGDAISSVWKIISTFASNIVKTVANAFAQFPRAVAAAFSAVIRVIASAIKVIVDQLSYLNPFARHSPSLVDNVIAGVDVIAAKYASLGNIGSNFRQAVSDMAAFGSATDTLNLNGPQVAKNRSDVADAAPSALPQFDALVASISLLQSDLARVAVEWLNQKRVTDAADASLKSINVEYDAANAVLSNLQKQASQTTNEVFANEQSINALTLAMLKMEDANPGILSVTDTLAKLQGEIELLRSEEASLRSAGAGSDITGPIDAQIAALQHQQHATSDQATAYANLQKQIDALTHANKELQLTQGLILDPQIRQQQQLVDMIGLRRDAAQAAYDIEKAKLDELGTAYDGIQQQIQDMTSALNDMASAASSAASNASLTAQEFAAAGDFATPGGTAGAPETGSIEALAKKWANEAKKAFGDANILKPIEDAWDKLVARMRRGWDTIMGNHHVVELTPKAEKWAATTPSGRAALAKAKAAQKEMEASDNSFRARMERGWDKTGGKVVTYLSNAFDRSGQVINEGIAKFDAAIQGCIDVISGIWNSGWAAVVGWLTDAWNLIKGVVGDGAAWVQTALDNAWTWIKNAAGDTWNWIKTAIHDAWEWIKGAVGDAVGWVGTALDNGWAWVKGAVSDTWDWITSHVRDAINSVPGIIRDAFGAIWQAGKDLGSGLLSGIGDAFNAAVDWAGDVGRNIANGLVDAYNSVRQWINDAIPNIKIFGVELIPSNPLPRLSHFHTGGISADEQLAVLQRGEGVLPRNVMQLLGPQMFEALRSGAGLALPIAVAAQRQRSMSPAPVAAGVAHSQSGGDRNLTFTGDLSFPNITSADDAEAFIRNLEDLAGS